MISGRHVSVQSGTQRELINMMMILDWMESTPIRLGLVSLLLLFVGIRNGRSGNINRFEKVNVNLFALVIKLDVLF